MSYSFHRTCVDCGRPVELSFSEHRALCRGNMMDSSVARRAGAIAREVSAISHDYVIRCGQGPSPWCVCPDEGDNPNDPDMDPCCPHCDAPLHSMKRDHIATCAANTAEWSIDSDIPSFHGPLATCATCGDYFSPSVGDHNTCNCPECDRELSPPDEDEAHAANMAERKAAGCVAGKLVWEDSAGMKVPLSPGDCGCDYCIGVPRECDNYPYCEPDCDCDDTDCSS